MFPHWPCYRSSGSCFGLRMVVLALGFSSGQYSTLQANTTVVGPVRGPIWKHPFNTIIVWWITILMTSAYKFCDRCHFEFCLNFESYLCPFSICLQAWQDSFCAWAIFSCILSGSTRSLHSSHVRIKKNNKNKQPPPPKKKTNKQTNQKKKKQQKKTKKKQKKKKNPKKHQKTKTKNKHTHTIICLFFDLFFVMLFFATHNV